MYFDFEDYRPDTPSIATAISRREGVLLSIIVHLAATIFILVFPHLPAVKAAAARREQALEAQRRVALEQQRKEARFVFVQPRVDRPAPAPPPRAELSDIHRAARTRERAANTTNSLPFARGNTSEQIGTAHV